MILLSDRWQFYKDTVGQWQWRKFGNNKVVAVSPDGFTTRKACVVNATTRGYLPTEQSYVGRDKKIETESEHFREKTLLAQGSKNYRIPAVEATKID
jgi:hypothetical protein